MITPIDEAFARLTMLEFAMEIHTANTLSWQTPESSDKWKQDFVRLARSPILPASLTNEQKEAEILQRSIQMAENFVQKVAEREALIRKSKIKDSLGQG
jgi:hypothetical protein